MISFFQKWKPSKDVKNTVPKKTVTVGFLVEDGKGVISVVEIQDGFVVLPKHSLLAPTNVLASAGPQREPMATLLICLHMVLWKLNSTDKEAVVSNWYRELNFC